jgi:hypothetical protein
MTPGRVVALVAGVAILLATASSVFRTLVLPRGLTSRLTTLVTAGVRAPYLAVASRIESYETRDRLLASAGPASLIGQLVSWLVLLLLAYTLLDVAASGETLGTALRESGSSVFTLGFASNRAGGPTAVDFMAAASGPLIVALQIAYLPTLYSAYNRRETEVTLLLSRAGAPAWGPEVLARHQLVGIVDSLPDFYRSWERWAAEIDESHTNYPALTYFRSPQPLRSWVVALLAVMDSAALYLALCPNSAPSEARLCLRQAFLTTRDVAQVVGIHVDPDPRPDAHLQLTFQEFMDAVRRLDQVGFAMERTAEEAWPHFKGWRVNYEAAAYGLARRFDAVPALWSGPRRRAQEAPMLPVRPANRTPERPEDPDPATKWKISLQGGKD